MLQVFWTASKIFHKKRVSWESKQRFKLWGEDISTLVYLNGNNAAGGENNIKYANRYPMDWTVKNWFVQDFKGHGHDTDEWRD